MVRGWDVTNLGAASKEPIMNEEGHKDDKKEMTKFKAFQKFKAMRKQQAEKGK